MREIKFPRVAIVSVICCAFIFTPLPGQGADLVIGSNISTSGNWSLNGAITANSFSGSGSGLTSVTASNLNCSGCVSASELSFIPGTITGISAGAGLTGGGNSGVIPLAVNFGGSGAASSVARSDHNHDSLYLGKYGKVAIVAQSGGDYPNPYAAMLDSDNWCGTASETNPCLVKVMPGIYDIGGNSVQMKSYIDIEGSGENTTKIKGNISANDSGVVRGATFAELRFLSVENTGGGGADAIAMYNYQAAPKITNVTLTARNAGRHSTALFNINLSLPVLTNVTLEAFDAANESTGVYSSTLCTPQLSNVKIKASGGGSHNSGVFSENYVITSMNNVRIELSGGDGVYVKGDNSILNMTNSSISCTGHCYGVSVYNVTVNIYNSLIEVTGTSTTWAIGMLNSSAATAKIENSSFEAKSGSLNIGVQNAGNGGNVTIDHSSITGADASIRNDSGTASFRAGASKISGPVQGTTICASSYNGNYAALGIDCR
jgi:hypothetical protein